MSRVLLFGENGMLGREIANALSARVELTRVGRGDADIRNPLAVEQLIASVQPSVVINAAAYTDVDGAERNQALAFSINALAAEVMAKAAQQAGATLVHFSTDYVFDGVTEQPYVEADTPAPINIYGESKLAGDRAIADSGVRHLILRVGWLYGARGRNFYQRVLQKLRGGEPISAATDEWGTPTSVTALAEFVQGLVCARDVRDVTTGTYHVSSGEVVSRHEFALAIAAQLGAQPSRVHPVSRDTFVFEARRPRYSVLNPSAAWTAFGIRLPDWRAQLERALAGSI